MAFDFASFRATDFEVRTATLTFPQLASFFGGDAPEFTVRGLSAYEVAAANEAAAAYPSLAEVLQESVSGTSTKLSDMVKLAFGFGLDGEVPRSAAYNNEIILRGILSPKLEREDVVKLALSCTPVHALLAAKIKELTAMGSEAKKKQSDSIETGGSVTP
jgi:hypothetical protein